MAPGQSRASGFQEKVGDSAKHGLGPRKSSGLRGSLVSGNFRAVAMATWMEGRSREVTGWWEMRKCRSEFTNVSRSLAVNRKRRAWLRERL